MASSSQRDSATSSSTASTATAPPRRHRYTRSSTASVTQLLSDSCNSLLQRFRKVPSEKPEPKRSNVARYHDLSPCVESAKPSSSMSDKSKRNDSSYGGSSTATSAFNRLRYNLSPVSSYYKPLMRTFSRREESPPKTKEIDREKTPLVNTSNAKTALSTISRLESKYSDVLGRVASRRRQEEDDREKTLEPDRPYMNPVTRSATTVLMGDKAYQAYQKERTPYKLSARNRSKYADTTAATGSSLSAYKPSSELSLLNENANRNRSRQTEYDPIRRKDTLYDAYTKNANRYQNNNGAIDHSQRSRGIGRENAIAIAGKEPFFKSKYDPDILYAEINNNSVNDGPASPSSLKDRERKRQIRSYKRTCTANDRRHTTAYKDLANDEEKSTSSRYSQRKSSGYQRSQTQKFFDSEDQATSNRSDRTEMSSLTEATPILSEREARRKEIQGLIMKYAQLDDVHSTKANEDQVNNNSGGMYGGPLLQPSASSAALSVGQQQPLNLLPLSKTQSVAAISAVRSRIPKTLSTFVSY